MANELSHARRHLTRVKAPTTHRMKGGTIIMLTTTAPHTRRHRGAFLTALATACAATALWSPSAAAASGPAAAGPTCAGKRATIVGTSRGEVIRGTSGRDVIVAGGGKDTVRSGKGADVICGGKGNDTLISGKGIDTLRGGSGHDRLFGGKNGTFVADDGEAWSEGDQFYPGPGNDYINPGPRQQTAGVNDTLNYGDAPRAVRADLDALTITGHGTDRLSRGRVDLHGSRFSDTLLGTGEGDTINGAGGSDRIEGRGGNDYLADNSYGARSNSGNRDVINGGTGNDHLDFHGGNDLGYGGSGADQGQAFGRSQRLVFHGEADNDSFSVYRSRYLVRFFGGEGNDDAYAIGSRSVLDGGPGKDDFYTGSGNDQVLGGPGDDTARTGPGDDTADGGDGIDTIGAGTGQDTCTNFETMKGCEGS